MFIQIFILILLILINGFFSASEIALLSINKIKLKSEVKNGNKKAVKIKKLLDYPSGFLATIQIGITLTGFLASAFAAESFADILVIEFSHLPISINILKTIIVVLITVVLSYFTLVFGELVPKRIGMSFPGVVSYATVDFINFMMKFTYPFVWLLTRSTNTIMKLFKVKEKTEHKLTKEEIKAIISTGKDEGVIEPEEKDLIFNLFNFQDTKVEKVMTSIENVVYVDINISRAELLQIIRKYKYTRIPVYEENKNNIVGILNIKNIIVNHRKDQIFSLKDYLQKPYFVNKDDMADDVFRNMQDAREAICIVMDDKNNFVGVITMEDAIEEIVGNIFDEFDKFKR